MEEPEPECVWRWSGLNWFKIISCPGQSGLYCPAPETPGGFVGQMTTTPCGGP